jgi:hypothetical protein
MTVDRISLTADKRISRQSMRFGIEPRDVPPEVAARRLGRTLAEFKAALPDLADRGFPQAGCARSRPLINDAAESAET